MKFTFSENDLVTITATGQLGQINFLQETQHGPQYEVLLDDGSAVMVAETDLALAENAD